MAACDAVKNVIKERGDVSPPGDVLDVPTNRIRSEDTAD
jgi:hypothetical protein